MSYFQESQTCFTWLIRYLVNEGSGPVCKPFNLPILSWYLYCRSPKWIFSSLNRWLHNLLTTRITEKIPTYILVLSFFVYFLTQALNQTTRCPLYLPEALSLILMKSRSKSWGLCTESHSQWVSWNHRLVWVQVYYKLCLISLVFKKQPLIQLKI